MKSVDLPSSFSISDASDADAALRVAQQLEDYVSDVEVGEIMPDEVEDMITQALDWQPSAVSDLRSAKSDHEADGDISSVLEDAIDTLVPLEREMTQLLRENENLKEQRDRRERLGQ
ncbi:hypothetical protein M426DRAFT_12630 [Hypoxylon sp. CI-4A]|nr:hypothetical protein M426DRAFT_12630 [Hypoxylon sp. CI-4A]